MNPSALPCLADRPTALSVQRGQKMARSAHAYVRGSTVKFYEWLEAQKRRSLPEGPPVWICRHLSVGAFIERASQMIKQFLRLCGCSIGSAIIVNVAGFYSAGAQPVVNKVEVAVPSPNTPFVFPKGMTALWQTEFACPVTPPPNSCSVNINGSPYSAVIQLSLAHVSDPLVASSVRDYISYRVVQNVDIVSVGMLPLAGGPASIVASGLSQISAGGPGKTMPYAP
jgi:Uncharacterized protein conserved in bacteria (DUF2252)